MIAIKSLLKTPLRAGLKMTARWQVPGLRASDDPTMNLLADALSETLRDELTSTERERINQIEALRQQLNRPDEFLVTTDYGSGTSTDTRTAEEMSAGTESRMSLQTINRASKPRFWALLLFKLVRKFQPTSCIELGTCMGLSAAYQSSAQDFNGGEGKFVTIEGSTPVAERAKENLHALGAERVKVINGRFDDVLDRILAECAPVDYAFIDGHHDEHATVEYFEKMAPHLAKRAVLVFDDISWSPGMKKAWKKIKDDPCIKTSLDLRTLGICVVDDSITEKKHERILLV